MPSKSWLRERGCERKVAFDTEAEAQAAIYSVGIFPYRCPFKQHWHTGHPRSGKEPLDGASDRQAKADALFAMRRRGIYPGNRRRKR